MALTHQSVLPARHQCRVSPLIPPRLRALRHSRCLCHKAYRALGAMLVCELTPPLSLQLLGYSFSSLLRPIINSCKTFPVYREHCSSHGCDHRVTLRSTVFHGSNGAASHRRCRRVLPLPRCRGVPSSRHLPIAKKRQSSC